MGARINATIPFTEIYERVQIEEMRDESSASSTEAKYKGRVNQVYRHDVPIKYDWPFLSKEITALDLKADYTTGSVTIAASSSSVTGVSTVWTSANSNNFKMKINGYDEIYTFTYSGSTSGTISPALTSTAATSASYKLYLERYALDTDFLRLVESPGLYYYDDGHPVSIDSYSEKQYFEKVTHNVSTYPQGFYIPEEEVASNAPYVYFTPPPTSAMKVHGKYIYKPAKLKEWTTGTASCNADATTVTGQSSDFEDILGSAGANLTNYDYYFRFDGDGVGSNSDWYKISACANDTGLTLASAYQGASNQTSASYTISMVPEWPDKAVPVLVYGACLMTAIEQDTPTQIASYTSLYEKAVGSMEKMYAKLRHTDDRMKVDNGRGRIV